MGEVCRYTDNSLTLMQNQFKKQG